MQFGFNYAVFLALLPSVLASPAAIPDAAPEAVPEAVPETLIKKACSYNGCTGLPAASAGTYCGFCKQVVGWGSAGFRPMDIFQIAGGGSSSCCEYGLNTNCNNLWNSKYKASNNVEVNC